MEGHRLRLLVCSLWLAQFSVRCHPSPSAQDTPTATQIRKMSPETCLQASLRAAFLSGGSYFQMTLVRVEWTTGQPRLLSAVAECSTWQGSVDIFKFTAQMCLSIVLASANSGPAVRQGIMAVRKQREREGQDTVPRACSGVTYFLQLGFNF